jgi:CBS domain-containing protein
MKSMIVKFEMSKKLITVKWNETLSEAFRLMEEYNIRHLPVLDAYDHLVGILSNRDLQRAMNPQRPGFAEGCLVSDFMSWPTITIDENTPIKQVAEGMIDEKISALLVTSGQSNIVGIVTSEDLLRYLAASLEEGKSKTLKNIQYWPVVGEIIKEAEAAGI